MRKKIIVSLMTFIVIFSSCTYTVSADSQTDGWTQVTTNEQLVQAFQYYCKSRDVTIDGSVADAVTSMTTEIFNKSCETLGIDITALQAQLKYKTDSNIGLQFYFDSSGISAYNRIFAQFLQDNNLEVGDSADETNNEIYSGEWFVDKDGHGCLVYKITYSYNGGTELSKSQYLTAKGTPYLYDTNEIYSWFDFDSNQVQLITKNIQPTSQGTTFYFRYSDMGNYQIVSDSNSATYSILYYSTSSSQPYRGNVAIIKRYSTYYLGIYNERTNDISKFGVNLKLQLTNVDGTSRTPTTVYITTNNTTINNNVYEGDTIINPDGSLPGFGGGGGDTPVYPDPASPELPDWGTTPSDPISLPSINLPDFDIDWSLKNITHKFPFCIPFDLVDFYNVLAVDPQAPSFNAQIPLGFTTWSFSADFSEYDDWASICRNIEYVGFVIGLIFLTIKLVRG